MKPRIFGISANGRTDVTEKIQTALDELYKIGGGTFIFTCRTLCCKGTLKIPQGVILAGDWQSPDENTERLPEQYLWHTQDAEKMI